ncbi:MAG: DNA repair protein RadC [Lachnospiraceae bacterium]|nr:DNA repair protein RadC [Lachnospiraceae bacterium]
MLVREGTIGREDLPCEKFLRLGAGALTDAELLAVIIRTGAGGKTPMEIGRQVLSAAGAAERGIANLCHLSLGDLMKIPGIGQVRAVQLKCIAELSARIAEARSRPDMRFPEPDTVAACYMERLRHEDTERTVLLSLNSRMRLITESLISVGTVNRALITPREVFVEALKNGAVNIILLHNHPGGDPTPSGEDLTVTESIREAGELVNIKLADHLIIGDGCYFSFREQGIL